MSLECLVQIFVLLDDVHVFGVVLIDLSVSEVVVEGFFVDAVDMEFSVVGGVLCLDVV